MMVCIYHFSLSNYDKYLFPLGRDPVIFVRCCSPRRPKQVYWIIGVIIMGTAIVTSVMIVTIPKVSITTKLHCAMSIIAINTLGPIQNGRDFQVHFLERKLLNLIYNLTEMCPLRSIIDNMAALVQIGAPNRRQVIIWLRLLTHICVTRPQGVNIRIRATFFTDRCGSSCSNIWDHIKKPLDICEGCV